MNQSFADDLKFASGLQEYNFYKLGSAVKRRRTRFVHERQISAREAVASGGAYTTKDVVLRVPASELVEFPPEVGGVVENHDRTVVWTIIEVQTAVQRTRWRLVCRTSITASDLTELVSFQEAKWATDTDNSPITNWLNVATAVPAKIQEIKNTIVNSNERRILNFDYRIFAKTNINVVAGMRVVLSSGQVYHVTQVSGKGVLGDLAIIDAVRPTNAFGG